MSLRTRMQSDVCALVVFAIVIGHVCVFVCENIFLFALLIGDNLS